MFNAERYNSVIQYGVKRPEKLWKSCIEVLDKENKLTPFVLNDAQRLVMTALCKQLSEREKIRLVILKARQLGITTLCNAILLWRLLACPNTNAVVMAHSQAATERTFFRKLIAMARHFASQLLLSFNVPPTTKTLSLATGFVEGKWANTTGGVRGNMLSFAHLTEIDEYKNFDEAMGTVIPCVPDTRGTCIIMESTSKGLNGNMHCFYRRKTNFEFVFLPWYIQKEYRIPCETPPSLTEEQLRIQSEHKLSDEQMNWYASKEKELGSHLKMQHEYPSCIEDCFAYSDDDTYVFDFELLEKATHTSKQPSRGRLILGIDPARINDKVAMVWRRGQNIERIVAFTPPCGSDDLLWERIVREIRNLYPSDIYIDVGGIGGNVPYILRTFGVNAYIHEVYFNQTPDNRQAYHDKRAEMYFNAKEWLKKGAYLPRDEAFLNELRTIKYIPDSPKFRIVEKSEIKKRLKHSPDIADAFALTFPYEETVIPFCDKPLRYVPTNVIYS